MRDSIGILLLVQVILIALNGIFASAEIAVLSISETKLEKLAEQGLVATFPMKKDVYLMHASYRDKVAADVITGTKNVCGKLECF